jgi:glycosyltransferase involved in cell wall biosynthesis
MRIGIDLTALLPEATGVDVSLKGLVAALAAIDRENRYVLFLNYEDRHLFADRLPANFSVMRLSMRPRAVRLAFQQALLPALSTLGRLDVVHSPSFIMPLVRGRPRHLLTVHDMTSFSLPDYHIPLRRSRTYRRAVLASIRRADLVTVPSRFVAAELRARVPGLRPDCVRVVPWGIGGEFRPHPDAAARTALEHLNLPSPYILFVGALQPRKNLEGLLEAYRRLLADGAVEEHLVIAGPLGWDYDAVVAACDSSTLRTRVHLAGYVRAEDLPWLYAGARLFVYPSFGEGFGFPPLEAMACGVATIAATGSALAENLAGAAELVTPDSPEALAAAMRHLLRHVDARERLRQRGLERSAQFRWSDCAQRMLDCYSELARGHSTRSGLFPAPAA